MRNFESKSQTVLMTAPRTRRPVPAALTSAARLRHNGRLDDAAAVVSAALAEARAKPLGVPFRNRVLLGLALTDLYLATDQRETAKLLLAGEVAFADQRLHLARENGSPDQIRAAVADCSQLSDRATQVDLLGRPAPEIEVSDWVLGHPTTLAEQRGRVVLVDFWARLCRSCLAMLPTLDELRGCYQDQGLTVLALTRYGPEGDNPVDRACERDLVAAAVAHLDLEIAVGIAPDGRLQQCYGATGIPTFAIIDQAGVVRMSSSIPDIAKMKKVIAGLLEESIT